MLSNIERNTVSSKYSTMETQTLQQKILLLSNDQKLKLESYINYLLEMAQQEESFKKALASENKKISETFHPGPLL